jgi:hypothetical protein
MNRVEHVGFDNLALEFGLKDAILSHHLDKRHLKTGLVTERPQEEFGKYLISLAVIFLFILDMVILIARVMQHHLLDWLSSLTVLTTYCSLCRILFENLQFLIPLFLNVLHLL